MSRLILICMVNALVGCSQPDHRTNLQIAADDTKACLAMGGHASAVNGFSGVRIICTFDSKEGE